jgi:hypothetical protein
MNQATNQSHAGLNRFAKNVTSQFGEDGILEKALQLIDGSNRWCVEFGAWDGRYCSNTHNLVAKHDYEAVLIEGAVRRFEELKRTFTGNEKVRAVNTFVGIRPGNSLDEILAKTPIPVDFDVLSIDIDGNDFHVWDSIQNYKPKIVVIEYNPTIPNGVDFVQPSDPAVAQGCSISSIVALGKCKGYELAAITLVNAIFVHAEYFDRLGIEDNSIATLREDESLVTYIFQGFDGTIFVRGCEHLVWHNTAFDKLKLQQLPVWLRKFPPSYSFFQRNLLKVLRHLRKAA